MEPKKIKSITAVIEKINKKDLMIPDFQRGFVWDAERIKKLFASVLCNNPIGTILTLNSDDSNFTCKMIGAQPRTCPIEKKEGKVDFLIDGQQRLTSLISGFTFYYHQKFLQNPKDIASEDLFKLYFLKIPAIGNNTSEDLFGIRTLSFPEKLDFTTNTIYPYIEGLYYKEIINDNSVKENVIDCNDNNIKINICNFCQSVKKDEEGNEFYHIPLQFNGPDLNKVLGVISESYAQQLGDPEKKNYWMTQMQAYLAASITSELQLSEINVDDSNKTRAIDIYNNLNQGGIELSILDLIIATVGTKSKENFYSMILDEMTKNFEYFNESLPSNIRNLLNNQPYNPVERADVINKNEIKASYISVFLDVLALLINKAGKKPFSIEVTKEDNLFKLKADDILDNYKDACVALARALFFFQTRCGIKTFDNINYKAQVTVVAYFFANIDLFKNEKMHDLFEYWYWISVFGWMHKSDQKNSILNMIPIFEEYIKTNNNVLTINDLANYKSQVFIAPFYSDQHTLTMDNIKTTGHKPPAVMTKYICQFYLAKGNGYKSFTIDTKHNKNDYDSINFLFDEPLEIHHLMPLGANKDVNSLIKNVTTKIKREDPKDPFNSPLNMLYITKYDNVRISNMNYDTYSKRPDIDQVLRIVGCPAKSKGSIKNFLDSRFSSLRADVLDRLGTLEQSLFNGVMK